MAAAELLAQAKQLAKDGNHLRASAAYFKAAKKEPENPEILIELALALLQLNKVSKALAAADDAIRIDPVSQKAYHVRGLALTGLKRLEDAVGSLQRAVEIGGDASAEIEAALAETKWQLRQQHEEAGTECPAVARDAEAPKDGEPELSAKDKMAFIRAQNKKNRQSKFARGQMADKGKAVTEVLGELAKDAEARADHVAQELSIGTGGEEGALLRYSAERVQRFLQAQLAKLAEALGDAEDADQYARPVAIVLPGKEAAQEEGPARLVSTDGGLTYTKEVTSDVEGQGVAMTGAFESMAQQKTVSAPPLPCTAPAPAADGGACGRRRSRSCGRWWGRRRRTQCCSWCPRPRSSTRACGKQTTPSPAGQRTRPGARRAKRRAGTSSSTRSSRRTLGCGGWARRLRARLARPTRGRRCTTASA